MRPSEYVKKLQDTSPFAGVLTPKEMNDAQDVLDAGYRLIGQKVSEHFDDMTPDAVACTETLQAMLCVFIEHANNFGLIRRAQRVANG